MDLKDAAFVKMRDSVSFYKIDPDEYVLRSSSVGARVYIGFGDGPCAMKFFSIRIRSCMDKALELVPNIRRSHIIYNTFCIFETSSAQNVFDTKAFEISPTLAGEFEGE